VQIYSLAGVLIKDLVQDRLAAGRQQVVWHADDNNGRSVASGVYLCLMRCETFVQSRKIILIK
jgi:hypothetical protein